MARRLSASEASWKAGASFAPVEGSTAWKLRSLLVPATPAIRLIPCRLIRRLLQCIARSSRSGHEIGQGADRLDGDADVIPIVQAEGIRRHDAGAGQQGRTARNAVVAVQALRERGQRPVGLP